MGALDSLKEAYYSLEDKWYGFVDNVSEKVPAFGNVVDSLEDKKIPTFPLAIIIVIIILLLLFLAISGAGNSTLNLTINDSQGNPVEGATVVVLRGTDQIDSRETNSDGVVSFSLQNGEYTVKADSAGHSSQTKAITLSGNTDDELVLSLGDATISRAVYLKTASGALVSGNGSVVYRCEDGTEENTADYSNGQFNAQVKESCPAVEIVSVQNYNVVNSRASFSSNSAAVLEEKIIDYGKASISLTATDGNVPSGLTIKLVPMDGTSPLLQLTQGTPLVVFEQAPVKQYYVLVSDSSGVYATYDGSALGAVKAVTKNQTTSFDVALQKSSSSKISVSVKDSSSGSPVLGAEVRITATNNPNDMQSKITGATGQVDFSVPQGTSYVVTADHPDYIIGSTQPATAGDSVEVDLVLADETNNNSLLVAVVDGQKNPIDNARVVLKKVEAQEPVVGEKTTDAGGEATFFNLELGKTYIASVSKEGFGSVDSTSIQVEPRQQRTLNVTFDIGNGTIRVKVLDPQKNPLSGVSVKAINYFTAKQEGTTVLTSTDGVAEFTIRADKKVYFVVESSLYSKYFTAAMYPTANGASEKDVVLQAKSGTLVASLIGIFSGANEVTQAGGDSSSATIAQGVYTVRALVQVPNGAYSEAGLHVRTGKETAGATNIMEEDGLYLTSVESSGRITKGTTYSPPNGYDKDSKNLTSGNAKWANSVWRNPQEGTYEVEAEITVTETNPDIPLEFYYRAWAKGASILRDPISTSSAQNELYSAAKKRILSLGATSLCSDNFCKSITVIALTGSNAGRAQFVSGTIQATKDTEYLLNLDLTNYSGKAFSAATLGVEGKGVDVKAISVNGAAESSAPSFNLGTVGVDAPLNVKVRFVASSSGTSGIRFTIASAADYKLDETVNVSVKPNKQFSLEILPKVIVPYITNTMFFSATDNNQNLQGVAITIKSGNSILSTVTTGSDGLAKYDLPGQRVGDELTITAQKEGYDAVEITKGIDEQVLTIIPPQIDETIKVGDVSSVTEEIIVQNDTAKNVKLTGVEILGDMKNYLDVKFLGTVAGTVIEQGKDRNYELQLKLNDAARRLTQPKDLTGTILINSEVSGAGQGFGSEIAVSVRLSLPGLIDNGKCLQVSPNTLEFITSDSAQSKTVTLTNACAAEGVDIPLHDIEAKLSEAAKFGTITISGEGIRSTQLGDKYTKLSDFLESNAQTELTINFQPSVSASSGTQKFTISLTGSNILEDNTSEKVEAQIKTTTTMSNLSKCLEIDKPQGGILLDLAPWNLGYNRLQSSSFAPSMSAYGAGYQGFANRSAPYNMPYMQNYSMGGYGAAGYGAGYLNSFNSGLGSSATASYQQNSFTIKNNCVSDIDIDLDPDPRLTVSTEKFTISKDSDETIVVEPGYVLGRYSIKVNAKATGDETKKKVDDVSVVVRRLGDIDQDCIKTNVTTLNLNSFIYRPQKYSVWNYCYDTGVQLARNNVASVECSAPTSALAGFNSVPYLQQGYDPYYQQNGYPLAGQLTDYRQYLQGNGCAASNCSLITGTRVAYRAIEQSSSGSVERVDFEILPSAQYIPQQKLFDNRYSNSGFFQSIGSIRQWATETDARTNVYGNLNISYTNQYGSGECMEFPITISDVWRIGESIDSAVNWGDPNARPADCQNAGSLNVQDYLKTRDPLNNPAGAISDNLSGYQGPVFIYIAEPPALRIGPSPTQSSQYYPQPYYNQQYYNNRQNEQKTDNYKQGNASANCGLLDKIQVETQLSPDKTGGARISVDTTSNGGSLVNNTKGSNLMVSIDRSGMTVPCVYVNVPITAKVTRAINLESKELTWNLAALIVAPGELGRGIKFNSLEEAKARCQIVGSDTLQQCTDSLKNKLSNAGYLSDSKQRTDSELQKIVDQVVSENSACKQYVSTNTAKNLVGQASTAQQTCENNSNDYGFDKIKKTGTDFKTVSELDSFCSGTSFCNSTQLELFLYNNLSKIDALATDSAVKGKLSELYKGANTVSFNECSVNEKFYKSEDGSVIINDSYSFPTSVLNANKDLVAGINAGTKQESSLSYMFDLLTKSKAADDANYNSALLEISYSDKYKNELGGNFATLVDSGLSPASKKYYMTLEKYRKLLEAVNSPLSKSACGAPNGNCVVNLCGNSVTLSSGMLEWVAQNSRLVKGTYDKPSMTKAEQEAIYVVNPKLNAIHKLAVFDDERNKANNSVSKGLALTQVTEFTKPSIDLFTAQEIKDFVISNNGKYTLDFAPSTTSVGKYVVELDYELGSNSGAQNVDVKLTPQGNVENASKAAQNVLLKTDFKTNETPQTLPNASKKRNALVEASSNNTALLYQRVPVVLNAELPAYQKDLSYAPQNVSPNTSLIKWYSNSGGELASDSCSGGTCSVSVAESGSPQTIKGIYYYPKAGTLEFGKLSVGASVAATEPLFSSAVSGVIITNHNVQGSVQLNNESVIDNINLDKVVELVSKDKKACVDKDGEVVWNEKTLLGAN